MDYQLDLQELKRIPGFNSLSVYLQQQLQQFIIDQFDHLNNTTIIPLKDRNNVLKSTEVQYNDIISDLRASNNNLSDQLQSVNTSFNQYKIESDDKISQLNNDNIVLQNKLDLTIEDLNNREGEIIELKKLKQNHFNQVQNLQNNIDTNQQNYENDLALQEKLINTQNQQLNLLKSQLNKLNNNNDISTLLDENERLNKLVQSDDKALMLTNEIMKLETELSTEKQSKKNLQSQLEQYINELESKLPLVESYKSKIDGLNNELIESKDILNESHIEIDELKQANLDLSHQLQYLLITLNIQSNPHQKLLSNKQLAFLQNLISSSTNTITTSQDIITDELVEFNDIINLQTLNAKLLKIVRSLSHKLEQTESQYSINNENNLTIINDAKNALETLETYSTELESKINELTTELDSYKNPQKPTEPALTLNEELQKMKLLQDTINNLTTSNNELVLKHEQSTLSNELCKKRIEMVESLLSNEQNLNKNHQYRSDNLKTELKQRDLEINTLNDKLFKINKDLTKTKLDLDLQTIKLRQQNIELTAIKGRDEEANKIIKSKESKLISLNSKLAENKLEIKQLNNKVNELQVINKSLNDLATSKNSSILKQIESDAMNLKWYENKVDLLKIEKSKLIKCITQKDTSIQSLNNTIATLQERIKNMESIHEMHERNAREENINWHQQLSIYKQQLSSTTNELNLLKQYKVETENSITDLHKQLNEVKNDYDEKLSSLNNELVEKNQSLQSLQSTNDGLIATQKTLENQTNELIMKMATLTKSDQEALRVIEANKSEIASLSSQIQSYEQTINDYKSKISQLETATTSIEFNTKEQNPDNDISDLQQLRDEKEIIWNQLISSQHEEVLLRNTLTEIRQQVASLTSELESLKQTRERSPDLFESSTEISELLTQVEEYKTKNIDAEDRFNRLKKQAHEKLKHSKDLANSLTIENEGLKTLNQQLTDSLKTSEEKIQNLESVSQDRQKDQDTIKSLQQELSVALENSKDIEDKLNEKIKNSHNVIKELKEEIDSLNNELRVLKNNNPHNLDDISQTVESMKKTFEEEKIQLIEKTRQEVEEKLSQNETISQGQTHGHEEIEKMKKELEDRISQEAEAKLQALKKENEDELQMIKGKAFEEGKQQAAMKTILLERKISKLESLLKDNSPAKDTSDTPAQSLQDIKTPDTVPVGKSSPFGSSNSTYNKLTFPFQSSTASLNPFTSPLDKNVFMTSSNNASTLKPTFSLQLSNRTASDIDTSEMTRDSSSDESNISSLKRSATDELADGSINKKIKEDGGIEKEANEKKEDTA